MSIKILKDLQKNNQINIIVETILHLNTLISH